MFKKMIKKIEMIVISIPEIGAGMNNPVAGGLLADALLHERFLGAEQFHGQLVIGGLEERLQLIADERRFGFAAHVGRTRSGTGLLLGRAVETHVVAAEVNATDSAFLKVHLGRDVVGHERRFVLQRRHQRAGARAEPRQLIAALPQTLETSHHYLNQSNIIIINHYYASLVIIEQLQSTFRAVSEQFQSIF